MKTIRYLGMLAAAVALASIVAAQEVRTDWDKNAVFERFHTYSWGRVRTSNPLWEPRIEEVVDKELSGKGWRKVQDGGDIVIMAVGATQNLQEYQTFYDGMGGWRWGGSAKPPPRSRTTASALSCWTCTPQTTNT